MIYGKLPPIPVPTIPAPQTQEQMTDGSWNPQLANDLMWQKYYGDVKIWIDKASEETSKPSLGKWIQVGAMIGGLILLIKVIKS